MRYTLTLALMCALLAVPGRARALDLETALRDVAAGSPTLAARRAMAEAARQRVGPAGAWVSPMVEFGAINVPTTGRFNEDPMTMKMVGVAQRVPVFGANRLSRGAARAEAGAALATVETSLWELSGMAIEAYADAYYANALALETEVHRGVMDRLVASARARYESGRGRLEDVLRAEAERARLFADLATFRAEESSARAKLDVLRGVVPAGLPDLLAAPSLAAVPADLATWLLAVTPGHPRLRELDQQVSRYRFAARAERRMAWPDLELRASYGKRETLAGGIRQDDMYSASVAFMVPLFSGERGVAEGAEMDAMALASQSERRVAELALLEQVTATHAAALAAQRTVGLLADTVVAVQRRAVDASWVAYSAGSSDLWRVFEASHSLYGDEIALQRARQDLAHAEARLIALTGRWDLIGVRLPEVKGSEP